MKYSIMLEARMSVKRIFKKNQIIITAMAALIAVAGYLNFAEKNLQDKAKEAAAREKNTIETDENGKAESDDTTGTAADAASSEQEDGTGAENESLDSQQTDGTAVSENGQEDTGTPGEAIFVNASGTVDFIVEAKMSKEYARVSAEESLQEIITDTSLTETEKAAAVERMVELTDISEREVAAENLIMAKGYSDVVVTKTDDYVDVIVIADEMDTVTRAQIEDIVKRKMDVEADKITINVIDAEK